MLPEFPAAQDAIKQAWSKAFFDGMKTSDPFLQQLEVRVQKEGTRAFVGNEEIKFQLTRVQQQCEIECGRGISFDDYLERAAQLGRDMAREQAKHCFEVLNTPGPRHAMVEKVGTGFSFDDFLEKMETMEIDFDKDGKPQWPTWYLDPVAYAAVQRDRDTFGLNPERMQRLAGLVAKKRKEFDEREARRRLVD